MNPNMTPIDWAKRPLERYADFVGRASRAEYWWFALAMLVVFIVISIIESMTGLKGMIGGVYGPLTLLLWLGTIVPSLSVGVRRLHDTGRSGWWMLLLVPYLASAVLALIALNAGNMTGLGSAGLLGILGLVCVIALLVFMVLPSTPGDNRYGPNPYGEATATIPANS
jgi:uncharacterized membrane protein YhaH (DUF805 family)